MATRAADISANIATHVRTLISRGTLAAGIHLGQTELAERFSASRVPVREALKLLAAEGLVLHDPNRGFFVAKISSEEAQQLYRIRHLLEVELLSTIEWPGKEQLADYRKRLAEMTAALQLQKHDLWSRLHREFHTAVFDLSPQKVLVREVDRLWLLTDRYRALLPMPKKIETGVAADEHHLIEALAKRDRKRLLKVFESDRSKIEQMLLEMLQSRGI